MSREEVALDTRTTKDKHNARVARFRPLKNLLLWLSGVVSGLVILVIALVVLPVGTILGAAGVDAKETVGEENGKKSIYGFVTGIKDMTIDDVPLIKNAIGEFTSPIAQFNEFTEVEEGETVDPAAADFVAALYYYKNASGEFCRAFDNEKNYVSGVNASTKLYYANISAVAVSDLPAVLTASLRNMKVVDLISGVSGDSEMTGSIAKILENTKVSELGSFDISGVKLSAVLSGENGAAVSEQLKKLLSDLAGAEYEEITIGALTSDFNVSKVHISTVIENNEDNATVVKLLTDAIGEGKAYDDITVEDFGSLDFTGVKLSTVLGDMDENSDLVKILKDATGETEFSKITVGDLKGLNTGKIKLSSVISPAENEKIFDILVEGAAFTGNKNDFTVSDIKNFNSDNIKLSSVIDPVVNKNVFDILADGVTGYEGNATDIKVGDIKGFNVSNVKLKTVMPTSGNKIIATLLKDETVTVGNAGDKINALKVSDVYDGAPCFVENPAGTGKYYKLVGTEKETFVLASAYNPVVDGRTEEGKTYDISTSSGVWFFMFYAHNSAGTDTDGYGIKYEATEITFKEMEAKVVEVSTGVQNATIRELVNCGLVVDPNFGKVELYRMTLHDMFEAIKAIP